MILFDQYENYFNQFIFNVSMWIGPDRERAILPKINGLGLMVSDFKSR